MKLLQSGVVSKILAAGRRLSSRSSYNTEWWAKYLRQVGWTKFTETMLSDGENTSRSFIALSLPYARASRLVRRS